MFKGYDQQSVDFMWGIRFNNEKEWFLAHKEEYLQHLQQPTKELGEEIWRGMAEKYPDDSLDLHVSRIYRDARRLHGRGPYKDHLWFSLRPDNRCDDWTGRPTFYFEIAPEYYSYGMGFWSPGASLMAHFRRQLDLNPEGFAPLARAFDRQNVFALRGTDYARSKGDPGELLAPWYQKKSVSLECERPLDEVIFSHRLAEDILADYETLMPLYRYFKNLCDTMA